MAKCKYPISAMQYLNEFIGPEETGLLTARGIIKDFIEKMEKKHKPLTGEGYPEDASRYCSVCMSNDGGSARHPCGTIKAIREMLGDV